MFLPYNIIWTISSTTLVISTSQNTAASMSAVVCCCCFIVFPLRHASCKFRFGIFLTIHMGLMEGFSPQPGFVFFHRWCFNCKGKGQWLPLLPPWIKYQSVPTQPMLTCIASAALRMTVASYWFVETVCFQCHPAWENVFLNSKIYEIWKSQTRTYFIFFPTHLNIQHGSFKLNHLKNY